ncbi:general transcription factor II-I repeat domain-containing protein 2B-like [Hydra vulgaris]|uniref:General transcription factor II-I repeat domain-containing protein 2B-like n=1 Tax=Hydra vulgaris TaxID=6087 RepID=A0ABM4DMM1_HYDVU
MELIELQNNKDLKEAYKEVELLEFYKKYMSIEVFPHLCRHAIKYFSLFGSTYNCEQLFSKIKHVKTEQRNRLTDEHLTNTLRIASSNITADIDHLCIKKTVSSFTLIELLYNFTLNLNYECNCLFKFK